MKLPVLRIFIAFVLLGTSPAVKAQVDTQDSLALVDLYNATSGQYWEYNFNWLTDMPVERWHGVIVTGNRVTRIILNNNWLAGSLPASIGNLTALTQLSMQSNFLTDTIPASLGNLTALTYLNLSLNRLTGKIPASLGNLTLLQTLYFTGNRLSDSIPATLLNLPANADVTLDKNNFTFAGMEGIVNHFIFPKYGQQVGQIPLTLTGNRYSVSAGGSLENNTYAWFKNGTPFTTITGDSTLTVTLVPDESYTVKVTNKIAKNFALYSTDLYRISDSLALIEVGKQLHAPWDTASPITTYKGVTVLKNRATAIAYNGTKPGTLSPAIGNLSMLTTLNLSGGYVGDASTGRYQEIAGPIPAEIGNLKRLTTLDLSYNKLSSSIPSSIGRLTQLTTLNLAANQLSGDIPDSLQYDTTLQTVNFSDNQLTGGLKPLGMLTKLQLLWLNNNQLVDTIPASFANLTSLGNLALRNNKLYGNISPIGNLVGLTNFEADRNNLTGSIPGGIGNCRYLYNLRLSRNNFTGTIPSSFGLLKKLQFLNLDNNQLSGKIPDSFANIPNLQWLNLSSNNLSGDNVGDVINVQIPPFTSGYFVFIGANRFTFAGMARFVQKYDGSSSYSPQHSIPIFLNNNKLSVEAGDRGRDTFRLYKNGILLAGHVKDSSFIISDTGYYYIKITNSSAKELTLYSDTIHITSLPVTLVNFTATLAKTDVQLNWQTAQEINTSSYTIERSINGTAFTSIGQINTTGNSSIARYYSYLDINAAALNTTKLYYRLKITDKDGSYSYSKIISLANDDVSKPFVIYPNPAHGAATVQFNAQAAGKYTIKVMAANGKVVTSTAISATAGSNRAVINTAGLPAGAYLVTIVSDKESKTLTLLKE